MIAVVGIAHSDDNFAVAEVAAYRLNTLNDQRASALALSTDIHLSSAEKMQNAELVRIVEPWGIEDRTNLATILGMPVENATTKDLCERIRWLYHSKTMATLESRAEALWEKVARKTKKTQEDPSPLINQSERPIPSFEELVRGAARKLKVDQGNPSIPECEMYIAHAVIVTALQRMKPIERVQFFEQAVPITEMAENAKIPSNSVTGPATTMVLLGAAQMSGFGLYVASTTALGFLTNAVGLTLPFAAYTGLTSTIAFIIGPAGWLAAGMWGAWKLIQPEWKKLIPAILYISATRQRLALCQTKED